MNDFTYSSISNCLPGLDPNKPFTEQLLEAVAKFPKPKHIVYQFNGTLAELKNGLEKLGVKIVPCAYMRETYDTLTGFDIVEVPEANCVLIGTYSDIQKILTDKENLLGNIKIFTGFEEWMCGRGDGNSSIIENPDS